MSNATGGAGDDRFDSARFRQVMGHFGTGVTIIAAAEAETASGLSAQSFTSVSLEPPLVLFCAGKNSTSWPRIKATGAFCANILSEDQEALCRTFASSGGDKFAGVGWSPSPVTGSPILAGVLAWVDCTIENELDGGDHIIVVGCVRDLDVSEEGAPLLFYRGGFGRFVV